MKEIKLLLVILVFLSFLSCRTGETHLQDEYIIDEIDLVPEGIAYSADRGMFYLTSLAKSKIIMVDSENGQQEDFISSGEYGFMPGAGILVDDKSKLLHAVGGYYRSNDSVSSLFTFDLESHKLKNRYDIQGPHFLNDLIKDEAGNIYITDTKGSTIYCLPADNQQLEVFIQSEDVQYPNGIAISDDGSKLYVASHTKGVRVVDLQTKQLLNDPDTTFDTKGIDGMEYYRGNLYAIQNAVRSNGYNFRKLILNKDQDDVLKTEVIEGDSQKLNLPLTFCIAGNSAVIITNSNLHYLDQVNQRITEPDSLKNTRLLIKEL